MFLYFILINIVLASLDKELLDSLVRGKIRECISDLNNRYGMSSYITEEKFDEIMNRNCCPVSQHPCPYDLWKINFHNDPVENFRKDL